MAAKKKAVKKSATKKRAARTAGKTPSKATSKSKRGRRVFLAEIKMSDTTAEFRKLHEAIELIKKSTGLESNNAAAKFALFEAADKIRRRRGK